MERNPSQNFKAFEKTEIKFKNKCVHIKHSTHDFSKRICKSTDETTNMKLKSSQSRTVIQVQFTTTINYFLSQRATENILHQEKVQKKQPTISTETASPRVEQKYSPSKHIHQKIQKDLGDVIEMEN